jgi:cyclohexanecarboxylate-CoA ligase
VSAFDAALARWARRHPRRVAVVDDRSRLDYGELDGLVDAIGRALQRAGIGPGDVVSSQLPNCAEALALCLAVTRIGAVHNPIVTIYREREVEFIHREANSAASIDSPDHELLRPDPGHAKLAPRAPATPHATRYLLYTSGSTSAPKGVRHSDRTLTAECSAQAAYHRLRADEVFVMPSPVGHISGLLYGILLPIWLGATSLLMPAWNPERFLALVEAEGGTFCGGATPFLQGVVGHPALARYDVSSLRLFPGSASAPAGATGRRSSRASPARLVPMSPRTSGPRPTGAQSAPTRSASSMGRSRRGAGSASSATRTRPSTRMPSPPTGGTALATSGPSTALGTSR